MLKFAYLPCAIATATATLSAQDSTRTSQPVPQASISPRWISRGDVKPISFGIGAVAVLSLADEALAKSALKPKFQNNRALIQTVDVVEYAGDPGAILISG